MKPPIRPEKKERRVRWQFWVPLGAATGRLVQFSSRPAVTEQETVVPAGVV